jgi:NAD(P)H dehydrogenase (quinone)
MTTSLSPSVIVAYHSKYGHTTKLAESVLEGVKKITPHAELLLVSDIKESDWEKLEKADAIIFGAPTFMGGPSAEFKVFADASSKPWFGQKWKDKIAAGFSNSGTINGDKFSTVQYLWTLSQQHGMVWVGVGLMPSNKKTADRNDINYLGGFGGLISQSPSDASPEEGPLPGDLKTAVLFGERVAKVTAQFIAGKK